MQNDVIECVYATSRKPRLVKHERSGQRSNFFAA